MMVGVGVEEEEEEQGSCSVKVEDFIVFVSILYLIWHLFEPFHILLTSIVISLTLILFFSSTY